MISEEHWTTALGPDAPSLGLETGQNAMPSEQAQKNQKMLDVGVKAGQNHVASKQARKKTRRWRQSAPNPTIVKARPEKLDAACCWRQSRPLDKFDARHLPESIPPSFAMQAHGMLGEIGQYWQSSRMLWLQPDVLGEQGMDTGTGEKAGDL